MPNVAANGIRIEYDTFGNPAGAPLLLVMGLGAHLLSWPPPFCELLAARGHYVIRYDNRDAGLSTHLESAGAPNMAEAMVASQEGKPIPSAYSLSDMAADGIGLLDALGIDRAHVVGASMGGMIAQMMAIEHPARVVSLTSMMSTTGAPGLPGMSPEAQAVFLTPTAPGRDGFIDKAVRLAAVVGSAPHLRDDDARRDLAGREYDRCFDPDGLARQAIATMATGSRRERLAKVTCPALVIHGEIDGLLNVAAGKDTAAAIPGADLLIIPSMGHDLPEPLWPAIADAIVGNTAKAR